MRTPLCFPRCQVFGDGHAPVKAAAPARVDVTTLPLPPLVDYGRLWCTLWAMASHSPGQDAGSVTAVARLVQLSSVHTSLEAQHLKEVGGSHIAMRVGALWVRDTVLCQ